MSKRCRDVRTSLHPRIWILHERHWGVERCVLHICGAGRCAPPYTPVQVCPSRYHKMLLNAYAYQNSTNKKPICIYTFIFIHSFIVEPVSVMTRLHSILTNDFVTWCCMYQGNNARNAFNNTSWSHCSASWSCMGSANDRRRYNVMSLIDWAHTWPWGMTVSSNTFLALCSEYMNSCMKGEGTCEGMTCDVNPESVLQIVRVLGPVSLRLMTSQFKDIVTHTQKYKTVKYIFCSVWIQNFFVKFQRCPFKDSRSVYMWI